MNIMVVLYYIALVFSAAYLAKNYFGLFPAQKAAQLAPVYVVRRK